jgi:hypothetical protein
MHAYKFNMLITIKKQRLSPFKASKFGQNNGSSLCLPTTTNASKNR